VFHDSLTFGPIEVRLARSPQEMEAMQKLRYKIFYQECSATPPHPAIEKEQKDFDDLDLFCDHLIAIDHTTEEVVGGYRLISLEAAQKAGGFLTSQEFDLSRLEQYPSPILELGRACVASEYRIKGIMGFLWQGIASYIRHHQIGVLFGCANFPGIDPEPFAQALSFLHHFCMMEEQYRPMARSFSSIPMNRMNKEDVHVRTAFRQLPPLIRGYLRLGGFLGEGAFIDRAFHSLDVCIVVETKKLATRYSNHYERSFS
jgi:putative hemolysin